MIWISENNARHIRQYISLQTLGDVVISHMGAINNRSIDVYPLQFINANPVGVKTRTLFPYRESELPFENVVRGEKGR